MTEHRPTDAFGRREVLRLVAAGTVSVAGLTGTGVARRVAGQASQPTVDLATPEHPARHEASGLLYGLSEDGSEPSNRWLEPIDHGLQAGGGSRLASGGWGTAGESDYARRWNSVARQYERVTSAPHDAEYCIKLADLWGSDATQAASDPHPGDDGDWSLYYDFLDRVMDDIEAAGMARDEIQYEIWNEPNIDIFWPRSRSRFHEMWRRGVDHIRSRHPGARIVGPSHTHFGWNLMGGFIDMTIETGTVPDILNWHVLQAGNDAVETASSARDLLADRGIDGLDLEVNEYVPRDRQSPGYTAWDLARVEKSDIAYAALANWSYCCSTPALCATLTQDGSAPTGRWWLYARYGQTRGDVVRTEVHDAIDAAANCNPERTQSRIIVGNHGVSRQVDLLIQNVDRISSDRVRIKVERMPDQDGDALPAPPIAQDYVTDAGSDHTVSIDWTTATDAYVVTVTPATPAIPDGTYRIEAVHSGHVLGVANGSTADGANVVQQAPTGGLHQRWTLTHVGDGVYRIENVATGKVLDVADASTANGATVHQWTDHGGENQRWRVEETRSGVYRIEAVHSGKVLDVEGGSIEAGATVHQWVDRSGDNQRWEFVAVEADQPPTLGEAEPTDPDDDGLYEDVSGDGTVNFPDVNLLFQNSDTAAVQDNATYFDFESGDGITLQDVMALFEVV
ncbi:MAG: RICIN domain-containing protein [Halococcoides sp.]